MLYPVGLQLPTDSSCFSFSPRAAITLSLCSLNKKNNWEPLGVVRKVEEQGQGEWRILQSNWQSGEPGPKEGALVTPTSFSF